MDFIISEYAMQSKTYLITFLERIQTQRPAAKWFLDLLQSGNVSQETREACTRALRRAVQLTKTKQDITAYKKSILDTSKE